MSSCVVSSIAGGLMALLAFIYIIQKSILNQREDGSVWGAWVDTPAMRELDRRWKLVLGPIVCVGCVIGGASALFFAVRRPLPGAFAYVALGAAAIFVAYAIVIAVSMWRAYRKPRE